MTQWVWRERRPGGEDQDQGTVLGLVQRGGKTFVFKCCDENNVTSRVLDKLKLTDIYHLFSILCCNLVMDPYLVGLQDSLDQRFQP